MLSPTPTPAPTVTVTETVTVTPPPPVVNIQMPADAFDPWRDIVLTGDFLGALAGGIIAVALPLALFLWERRDRKRDSAQLRADREQDLKNAEDRLREDRRTLLASQLLDAVSATFREMTRLTSVGELRGTSAHMIGWTGRVSSMYRDDERHAQYAEWLSVEGRAAHFKISLFVLEMSKERPERDGGLLSYLGSAVIADLIVIEKSTIHWIKGGIWEPHLTARHEWERNTKLDLALRDQIPNVPDLDDIDLPDDAEAWLEDLFAVHFTLSDAP